MIRALYTASTGMSAQQLNIDNISNNIANVSSTGFKKQRVEFQDLLYQTIKRPAIDENVIEPVGIQVGLGVKPVAITTLFDQGSLTPTNNPLDIAISGNGFIKVEVPGFDEPLFTRDGSFKIDSEGQLVTAQGYLIVGADAIDEGGYDVTIGKDGLVTYFLPDDTEPVEAGQIELATFANPAGLNKIGENLYQATPNSGEPVDWDPEEDSTIFLTAGYLEDSNVKVVEEMVDLITAQRAYEFNSKIIQASDEMLQTAANLKRG